MPCISSIEKFPCIYQIHQEWCVPASIENVIKYNKGDLSQRQIVDYFIEKFPMGSICFDNVKNVLDINYGESKGFEYEVIHHPNKDVLLNYVEGCIRSDLPVIISVQGPNGQHMLTVLCIDEDNIKVFDTSFNSQGIVDHPKAQIRRDLSPGRGTFTIIRT